MNEKEKQKLIEQIAATTHAKKISNCSFVGGQFDAKAVNAIESIAQGLIES